MGKLALKKPSAEKKHEHKSNQKLAARSIVDTWLGVYPRTSEHIIKTADGKAIRVHTVNRVAEDDRWKLEPIDTLRSLPQKPHP